MESELYLPVPLTTFVGRDQELADITQRLTLPTRLLTLVGTGGAGKTRLALQTALNLAPTFGEGVYFVDLAGLTGQDFVTSQVAKTLQVKEEPGRTLLETLTVYLKPRTCLLILDNCEHLVTACATLVSHLLQTCPALRILVTSREVLGVSGEMLLPVQPLAVPAAEAGWKGQAKRELPAEDWLSYPAIRLFYERAKIIQPAFQINPQTGPLVSEICRRLDGLPLSIELTVPWVRVLSLEQILAQLDQRFRFLRSSDPTINQRHQNMTVLIDWSYALLSAQEQRMLNRLSVFASSWSLEAATIICTQVDQALDAFEILELHRQLIDKSIIQVTSERTADGRPTIRYYLLETVRLYAWQRLVATEEAVLMQSAYLDWSLQFAQAAEVELNGTNQQHGLNQLEREYDHLRSVLNHTLNLALMADHNPKLLLNMIDSVATKVKIGSLVAALWRFWEIRTYYKEGNYWLERVLAQTEKDDIPWQLKTKLLYGAGILAGLDDFDKAYALQTENLQIRQHHHDLAGEAEALGALGWLAFNQADFEKAAALTEASLAKGQQIGSQVAVASAFFLLALLSEMAGHHSRTIELAQQGLPLWQAIGDQSFVSNTLTLLGVANVQLGQIEAGKALLAESLTLNHQLANWHGLFSALLGIVKMTLDQPASAKTRHQAIQLLGAIEAKRDTSLTFLPIFQPVFEDLIQAARQLAGEADFAQACTEGAALTVPEIVTLAQSLVESEPAQPDLPIAISNKAKPLATPLAGLTEREVEVCRWLAEGLTNTEIAGKLVLSRRTVEAHLRSIYDKLDLTSRSAAIRFLLDHEGKRLETRD